MGANQDEDWETALLDALDAADEYIRLQHALATLLKSGFLNISRARYTMGAGSVRASQYATEVEPSICVAASSGDGPGEPGEWRLKRCTGKLASGNAGGEEAAHAEDGGGGARPAFTSSLTASSTSFGSFAEQGSVGGSEGRGSGGGGRGGDVGYSSLISEFAARFSCGDDGSGPEPTAQAPAATPPARGQVPDAAVSDSGAAKSLASAGSAAPQLPAAPEAALLRTAEPASSGVPLAGLDPQAAAAKAEARPATGGAQQASGAAGGQTRETRGVPRARRDPLLWFGALVPPHLRSGQVWAAPPQQVLWTWTLK